MRKVEAHRRGFDHLRQDFLIVGEGGFYQDQVRVDTLLGSCVAVTLFCPFQKAGGVFHALLPTKAVYVRPNDTDYRFVDSAIDSLCTDFLAAGMQPRRLEAKVFGGSHALTDKKGIGRKNVEAAFTALKLHGIRVIFSSVGGKQGRRIVFLPHTGEVYMKLLNQPQACSMRERRTTPRRG